MVPINGNTPLMPKILKSHNEVEMTKRKYEGALGDLVTRLIDKERRTQGELLKVMILSAPDSSDTLKPPLPIPNDLILKRERSQPSQWGSVTCLRHR